MGHRCPTCDKELNTEQGMKQHHAKVHGESLPNCVCNICGDNFYHPSSDRKRCDEHRGQGGELNGNYDNAKESSDCVRCGETFQYYPSEKPGKYCKSCAEKRVWSNGGKINVSYQHSTPIGPEPYNAGHDPTVKTRSDGYEMIDTQYRGERVAIGLHRLLAIAEYGIDSVKGKDIHHKNEVKWDNRPTNIIPVTPEEHGKIHQK